MRKSLLLIVLCIVANNSTAQSLTLQQKFFYTCKVWGFVKYYHSNVSTCHVNWDSVLLSVLPALRSAANDSEFNDALDTLLGAAGTMALATSPPPVLLSPELRRNLNFNWLHDTIFRNGVITQLDTIRNNFRPHRGCFVHFDSFGPDTPLLNMNTYSSYPDSNQRQLMFFKYWNIINYFYPYNYVLDKPVDTILFNNIIPLDTASDDRSFFMAIRRLTSYLNDAHAGGGTYSNPLSYDYWYTPKLVIRYIENKYVVVKSGLVAVQVGDAIVSVDGHCITEMEDSMKNYVSAGNLSVFRRFMYKYQLLGGFHSSPCKIVFAHPAGGIDSAVVLRNTYWGDSFVPEFYYPADSLGSIHWTTLQCGIGYMNLGNMSDEDAYSGYNNLHDAPAIIVDLRSYPISNAPTLLANYMYASPQVFERIQIPDTNYPGTYYWDSAMVGVVGNPTPYLGTVIFLVNEETQSFGEASCVLFDRMPHVVKIGSQTAGAYGLVARLGFSKEIRSEFTYLSMFYPNGDSIQRIGLVPDSVVKPTVAGILSGRDEVVEKALEVACALPGVGVNRVDNNAVINVYPNPADDMITVSASKFEDASVFIQILDFSGRVVFERKEQIAGRKLNCQINVRQLSSGMYSLSVRSGMRRFYVKFTKE